MMLSLLNLLLLTNEYMTIFNSSLSKASTRKHVHQDDDDDSDGDADLTEEAKGKFFSILFSC